MIDDRLLPRLQTEIQIQFNLLLIMTTMSEDSENPSSDISARRLSIGIKGQSFTSSVLSGTRNLSTGDSCYY